jgi:hypothetical protein
MEASLVHRGTNCRIALYSARQATRHEDTMRKSRGTPFDLAMDSAVAATSTAMTLWHRLPMFGFASMMTPAERHAEGARMVDEKAAALIEGSLDAGMEAVRAWSAAAMGNFAPLLDAPLAIANAGMRPAFRTVNANAKRLNRRAAKSAFGG